MTTIQQINDSLRNLSTVSLDGISLPSTTFGRDVDRKDFPRISQQTLEVWEKIKPFNEQGKKPLSKLADRGVSAFAPSFFAGISQNFITACGKVEGKAEELRDAIKQNSFKYKIGCFLKAAISTAIIAATIFCFLTVDATLLLTPPALSLFILGGLTAYFIQLAVSGTLSKENASRIAGTKLAFLILFGFAPLVGLYLNLTKVSHSQKQFDAAFKKAETLKQETQATLEQFAKYWKENSQTLREQVSRAQGKMPTMLPKGLAGEYRLANAENDWHKLNTFFDFIDEQAQKQEPRQEGLWF